MNIYETCPTLESEKFIIRLFKDDDCDDLLKDYVQTHNSEKRVKLQLK